MKGKDVPIKTLAEYRVGDHFEDHEGLHYDDAESLVGVGVLNFCGCGDQSGRLELVAAIIEERQINQRCDGSWTERSARWRAFVETHLGNEIAAEIIFNWLDNLGFLDHGSSLPGWPTERGLKLVALIREALKEDASHD